MPAAATVLQFASARGVRLPDDIQIQRGSPNRLIGAWGGQWAGRARYAVLAVEAVDANGRAVIVYGQSGPNAFSWNKKPALWRRVSAQLQGNSLEWTFGDGAHFRYTLVNDNQLFGELNNGEQHSSAYFDRLQ